MMDPHAGVVPFQRWSISAQVKVGSASGLDEGRGRKLRAQENVDPSGDGESRDHKHIAKIRSERTYRHESKFLLQFEQRKLFFSSNCTAVKKSEAISGGFASVAA